MSKKYIFSNKGFSLVELLVAATIIGMLAVLATTYYRGSVAETRWAQAKANVAQLAVAVERAKLDYPGLTFDNHIMNNPAASSVCQFTPGKGNLYPSSLITCGYLERKDWASNGFVQYAVCDKSGSICTDTGFTACVKFIPESATGAGDGAKVPAKFKKYQYCYSSILGEREKTE